MSLPHFQKGIGVSSTTFNRKLVINYDSWIKEKY
jgi:hypothetical protein